MSFSESIKKKDATTVENPIHPINGEWLFEKSFDVDAWKLAAVHPMSNSQNLKGRR